MFKTTLFAGGALFAISAPAIAQVSDADRSDTWTPQEIIVTGQRNDGYVTPDASTLRTSVPILETPQSVQVLTRQLLKDQELITLDEALQNVSGVVPSLASEALLANPIVRGFEAEIFNDGLIGYGDTAVSDPGSLWHVERVEVAKGPTSTLFGGGTGAPVGGLINQVTKTANGKQAFEFQLRGGSFETYAVAGDANVPLSDAVAVRLVGEYQSAGDYIDKVDIDRVLILPSIRIVPADGTELVAKLNYSRVKQLEYAGLPAFLKDNPAIKRDRFTGATDAPRSDIENVSIDFGVTQKLTEGITANIRARRYESDFTEYSTSPFFAFFPCSGTTCPIVNGILPAKVGEWTIDGSVTAEFKTGSIEHVLLAGAQYDATDYRAGIAFDFVNIFPFDYANPASDFSYIEPTVPAASRLANNYRTLGFYVQDQLTIADRLHILASLRYSKLRIDEVLGGAGNDETYHEVDPRIGASFDVIEGVSLFAGYATGSRLSIFFNGTNSPLPERSESAEAGVKFGLTDIGLSGTIAAYRITRTNVPTPDPTTFFTSIQTGKQRSEGVELDLIYEPSKAVSLLGSYAFTDAEVVADTVIPPGARLARVPKHRARIAARYRFLSGAVKGLELGAGMTAASRAFITLPNGLTSDSYAVFDAQASYQWGPARLGLRVDNLFNNRYFLPYQYFAQDVVRPGNPRSAYLTLNFGF